MRSFSREPVRLRLLVALALTGRNQAWLAQQSGLGRTASTACSTTNPANVWSAEAGASAFEFG
jgi:hypothetical protein